MSFKNIYRNIGTRVLLLIHVIASQLFGHCDAIGNRLWRHQQNENRVSETRGRCVKLVVFIVIYGFVMSCKKLNNVCILVTDHFCARSSVILVLLRNSGNKHKNNPLVSAETVRHSSTYIFLYLPRAWWFVTIRHNSWVFYHIWRPQLVT